MTTQLDAFAAPREAPHAPPLHRRRDPETSRDAAARVAPKLTEEWRPIFDGFYEVSNEGRVRRIRPVRGGGHVGREVKAWDSCGYRQVSPCVRGVRHVRHVHALVAEAFLGPRPDGMEINHIDADKSNNAVWNLEYVTRSENARHAAMCGLTTRGERHYAARLTAQQAADVRRRHRNGERVTALAREYGVTHGAISLLLAGKTWNPAPRVYREATPDETARMRAEAGC